jgi:hypothetical protein
MVEELTDCVRTLLTAADICQVTTRVLSRQFGSDPVVVRALLTACWMACRAGREVCEEYAPVHDHCRVCARACRAAERACRVLLAVLQGPTYPYSKEGSSDTSPASPLGIGATVLGVSGELLGRIGAVYVDNA